MERKGSAVWQGGLKGGKGTVSTASGILDLAQYSYTSRFDVGYGTNPEELIAAAHAACFSMALSALLEEAGFPPDHVDTTATVTMQPVDGQPTVTGIHLEVLACVPDIADQAFELTADKAKAGCPISRLLTGAPITMRARLTEL